MADFEEDDELFSWTLCSDVKHSVCLKGEWMY